VTSSRVTSPRVIAIGGGHGTAVTLRAARLYAGEVTAIVSVADDGGSSGRLREQFDVVALGDLRKCLVALAAEGSVLARAFEHRFAGVGVGRPDGLAGVGVGRPGGLAGVGVGCPDGLRGHALGNLVLAGLVDATGDLVSGIDAAAALLAAEGRVLPATTEKVTLKAEADRGEVNGQVAVSAAGRIQRVSLVPGGASPPAEATAALRKADQVVIGPGSLYTSVLAAVLVPGIAEALAETDAQKVYVCNLFPQVPETEGYDVAAHVAALREHGVEVDVVLWDSGGGLVAGPVDLPLVDRRLAGSNGLVHDPARLAAALSDLLA